MAYAPAGDCGLRVSRIGLGMMSYGDPARLNWALPEDQAEPIVRQAVELGINIEPGWSPGPVQSQETRPAQISPARNPPSGSAEIPLAMIPDDPQG